LNYIKWLAGMLDMSWSALTSRRVLINIKRINGAIRKLRSQVSKGVGYDLIYEDYH
jgi:hypothetical protein